jgi:hypothetical protein
MHSQETPGYADNYLSKEYQISGIKNFSNDLEDTFHRYIRTKTEPVNKKLRLHEIKDNSGTCTKKQTIVALSNELKDITQNTLERIEEQKTHNNTNLLAYMKAIRANLSIAENLFNSYEKAHGKAGFFKRSNVHDIFKKEIDYCNQIAEFLEHAVDINLYAVRIPVPEYKNIYKKSKSFHYEGNTTATAKTIGGSVLALGGTGATIAFFPAVLALGFLSEGAFFKVIGESIKGAAELAKEGATNYGYSCKIDFPNVWIEGRINKNETGVILEKNDHYKKIAEKTKLVYILDCRNPQEIYEHGTNYLLNEKSINPHGHVVFFHNIVNALTFTKLRTDGFTFDKIGGWRLQNHWTDAERDELRHATQLKLTISEKASLPAVITDIIIEYVAPTKRIK